MRFYAIILILSLIMLPACPARKDGAIEGRVSPPDAGARITVTKDDKTVMAVNANTQDGKFRIALAPGSYDIQAASSASPFPMTFFGIMVKPGETTVLPPIELTPATGASIITGKIVAADTGTHITLLYEGKERAAVRTDAEGKYEFTKLPAGRYAMQINSPGFANDAVELNLSENQRASLNARLLYITALEGVDWAGGIIRARGLGLPPKNVPNATVRREMAKRAAIADGQRNLLKIIGQVKLGPSQTIQSVFGEGKYVEKLRGFIEGYRIASVRDMDGGRIEVELELPLTGPGGLSSYISF